MLTIAASLKRVAAAAAVFGAAAVGLAQQPLVAPTYYAFQLEELVAGEPLAGELTVSDGQNFKDGSRVDLYSVQATAGESLIVRVSSTQFDPVVSVYDQVGNLVAYVDYGQTYGDVSASFVAESTGRYVVVVSGWTSYDLGTYTVLRVAPGTGPSETIAVTLPATVTSTITSDLPPLISGFGGGAEYYTFDVTEETMLVARLSSNDFDTVLTLYDSRGEVIASNDDDGMSTNSMLTAFLEPGVYTIAASSYFVTESGVYTLTLEPFYRR